MRWRRGWLAWIVAIGGCYDNRLVPCGELLGPASAVCTVGGCASAEAAAACDGKADGDDCASASISAATCSGGSCHPTACGNAIVDSGEHT